MRDNTLLVTLARGFADDEGGGEPNTRHRAMAQSILDRISGSGHGIVRLVQPAQSALEELEDGDDPRVWRGPFNSYYVENSANVRSEFGGMWSAENAAVEAGAILGAAIALSHTVIVGGKSTAAQS